MPCHIHHVGGNQLSGCPEHRLGVDAGLFQQVGVDGNPGNALHHLHLPGRGPVNRHENPLYLRFPGHQLGDGDRHPVATGHPQGFLNLTFARLDIGEGEQVDRSFPLLRGLERCRPRHREWIEILLVGKGVRHPSGIVLGVAPVSQMLAEDHAEPFSEGAVGEGDLLVMLLVVRAVEVEQHLLLLAGTADLHHRTGDVTHPGIVQSLEDVDIDVFKVRSGVFLGVVIDDKAGGRAAHALGKGFLDPGFRFRQADVGALVVACIMLDDPHVESPDNRSLPLLDRH